MNILDSILNFLQTTGIAKLVSEPDFWKTLVMFVIAFALAYLAIEIGRASCRERVLR